MNFTQRLWMIAVAHLIGVASVAAALLFYSDVDVTWWLLVLLGHFGAGAAVSVGLHRYFTHASFKTTEFWHWTLAVYSTLTVQGSPLGWAAAHATHHRWSDTDRDPHMVDLSYLLWKRYNRVPMVLRGVRRLVSDPAAVFTHRYAVLIILSWVATLLALGVFTSTGIKPLLFGYLVPLGTVHTVGAIHQVTSHRFGKVANWPLLEYLLPASGEWNHGHHHDKPKSAKLATAWWHLDTGWWLIKLIRTDK